jgi:hypothetical protein
MIVTNESSFKFKCFHCKKLISEALMATIENYPMHYFCDKECVEKEVRLIESAPE